LIYRRPSINPFPRSCSNRRGRCGLQPGTGYFQFSAYRRTGRKAGAPRRIFPRVDEIKCFIGILAGRENLRAVLALLFTGSGSTAGGYPKVVNHFIPRDFAVYGFDHRGHGRSPGSRGHINSWDEYRGDVKKFLQLIFSQERSQPVFLWGHSMGALIALDYLLRDPANLRRGHYTGSACPGRSRQATPGSYRPCSLRRFGRASPCPSDSTAKALSRDCWRCKGL